MKSCKNLAEISLRWRNAILQVNLQHAQKACNATGSEKISESLPASGLQISRSCPDAWRKTKHHHRLLHPSRQHWLQEQAVTLSSSGHYSTRGYSSTDNVTRHDAQRIVNADCRNDIAFDHRRSDEDYVELDQCVSASNHGKFCSHQADTDGSFCRACQVPMHTSPSSALAVLVAVSPAEMCGSFSPVTGAMHLMNTLQSVSHLPWWATLSVTAIGVRMAMLPLSMQQMRATSASWPLLAQARTYVAQQSVQHRVVNTKPTAEARSAAVAKNKVLAASQTRQIAAAFWRLRKQTNAPHPAWILAVPLIQLPVFVTAMWAARRMAADNWPGLTTGGAAWFPDLTAPALDLSATFIQQVAPLGTLGAVLPLAVTAAMFTNVGLAFGNISKGQTRSPVAEWLGSKVRLALEWVTVPMLIIALQLAHAPLVYWLSSTLFTLGQHVFLQSPAVRSAMGLLPPRPSRPLGGQAVSPPFRSTSAATTESDTSSDPHSVEELSASDAKTMDDRLGQAAALAVAQRFHEALPVLMRILDDYPGQPEACFALGAVHAALGSWSDAADLHRQAAKGFEGVPETAARCWLGYGVALQHLGDMEGALEGFRLSADLAAPETPVLRLSDTLSRRPRVNATNGGEIEKPNRPSQRRSRTVRKSAASGSGRRDTAVRALLCAASLLAKAGRQKEALPLVQRATNLDPLLRDKYLKPLEAEVAGGGHDK